MREYKHSMMALFCLAENTFMKHFYSCTMFVSIATLVKVGILQVREKTLMKVGNMLTSEKLDTMLN